MSTPTEEAARQAVQQLAALIRALIEITRILQQARARQQAAADAGPQQAAERRYAATIERTFGPQVRQALTGSPEWPRLVQQLGYLERVGIAPEQLCNTLATITRHVAPQPAAQGAQAPTAGPQDYAQMVRQRTDPAVAQALTGSPEWPRIAGQLRDLHQSGVDVPRLLAAAQPELSRLAGTIDATWQRTAGTAVPQPQAPAPAPPDRQTALAQAGISTHDNARLVRMAREAAPGRDADRLVASKGWPQVATAMRALEQRGIDPGPRLGRLAQELRAQAAAGRRFDVAAAALNALSKPAAPATPGTGRVRGPAAAERARTVPDETLRRAADIAGTRGVISARMLMEGEGLDARETGRVLTELERHRVIGPRGDSGLHAARASSAAEARALLDAGAQRELTAAAASAASTTAAAPPRAGGPAPAAAAAKPAEAPARTAGRRR